MGSRLKAVRLSCLGCLLALCLAADALAGLSLFVCVDAAPLRPEPAAEALAQGTISRGAQVEVLAEAGAFLRVRDQLGREGFVYRGHLDSRPAPPALADLFAPPPASIVLAEMADTARSTRSHGGPGPAARDLAPLWRMLDLGLGPAALEDFLRQGGLGEHARVRPSSAAAANGFPPLSPLAPPGGEDERQIGLNLAARAVRRLAPPAFGQCAQRYVNLVGLAVARFSPAPLPGFRAVVLETPTPLALTLPGGLALLSTGLLAALENEAQLALVLARAAAESAQRRGWALALGQPFYRGRSPGTALTAQAAQTPEFAALLDALEEQLFRAAPDPGLERAADAAALHMAWKAGFDPQQWPRLLELLEGASQAAPPGQAEAGAVLPWPRLHAPLARRLGWARPLLEGLPRDGLALGTARFRANR